MDDRRTDRDCMMRRYVERWSVRRVETRPSQRAAGSLLARPAAHRLVESRLRLPNTIVVHERAGRSSRTLILLRIKYRHLPFSLSFCSSRSLHVR